MTTKTKTETETCYDITIAIDAGDAGDARPEIRDIVVSGETLDQACDAARRMGRIVLVQGVHGTGIAYR